MSCSQSTKFGESIFTRFWDLLYQPVYPKSNIRRFRLFSSFYSALFFSWIWSSSWKGWPLNNFCSFVRVSSSQPTKFGKSILTRFWGMLFQPVHPGSNISHFCSFSVLNSALWFYIKSRRGLRRSILKKSCLP